MSRLRSAALLALLAVSMPVCAQIYKCQEGDRTVITDRPCHADTVPLGVRPATGAGDGSGYNSSAARTRRDVEYARELKRREEAREARREISRDYDRRIDEINKRYDKQRCDDIRTRIDRYESHLRTGASARMFDWYKAEKSAAEKQYSRECR